MSEVPSGSQRMQAEIAFWQDDFQELESPSFDWAPAVGEYPLADDLVWDEGIHRRTREIAPEELTQAEIVKTIETLLDSVEGVSRRLDSQSKRFDSMISAVERATQEAWNRRQEAEVSALHREFELLAAKWEEETSGYSASSEEILHPAYLRIIGMGKTALPWILDEMSIHHGQWFVALEAITGENPILEEDYGRRPKMRAAWQEWGRKNGWIS